MRGTNTRCTGRHACFLLATVIVTASLRASLASLAAVYSLQRHGARNVLPKTALLAESDLIGGPTLLPQGQRQTYEAGVAFRRRYREIATCSAAVPPTCLPGGYGQPSDSRYGVVGQPGVGYGNFDVFVRSSALDRSIMSGLCFFNGIFPDNVTGMEVNATQYLPSGAQVIPIYTQSDTNDVLIRAYTKCPAYQDNLEAWFRSEEFRKKEDETSALRAKVRVAMPSMDTSLKNWWNVYDAINVWRTYRVGDETPTFDDDFGNIQALAYWLETTKMRSNLTNSYLGGVALADVVAKLQGAAAASANSNETTAPPYYRLLSLSGHYNTQLGVLAALRLDLNPASVASIPWFSNIPRLAAVMVFELHYFDTPGSQGQQPGRVYYVRLVAQDGPAANYTTVPLPCTPADSAALPAGMAGACTLDAFVSYASPYVMNSVDDWCTACGNADVATCMSLALQKANRNCNGGGTGSGEECHEEGLKVAVGVLAAVAGLLLLVVAPLLLAGLCMYRRKAADAISGASTLGLEFKAASPI